MRQLYLDAGAVDVAVATGDQPLLDAVIRRWTDMVATRAYVTGGLGSRHRDEAFGDPYELPPDRAYAETCAAIASVMLSWRLLLATGEARFADQIERTAFNGLLSGLSLDGTHFFYVNPLQRRSSRSATTHGDGARQPWYPCACCPPNLMRFIATWEQYLATADADGVQLHQYAPAEVETAVAGGTVRLAIETGYPWAGRVEVRIVESPGTDWTLALRVPPGSGAATVAVNGDAAPAGERVVELRRRVGRRRPGHPRPRAARDRDAVRPPDRRDPWLRRARARPDRVRPRDGGPSAGVRLEDVEVDPAVVPSRNPATTSQMAWSAWRCPASATGRAARQRTARPARDPVLRLGQPSPGGDAGLDPRHDRGRGLSVRRSVARSTRGRRGSARTRP